MSNETARGLAELGIAPALAVEIQNQLENLTFDSRRVGELGFGTVTSQYFARSGADGTMTAPKLAETGVATEVAKYISARVQRVPRVVDNPSIDDETVVGDVVSTDGGYAVGPGPITFAIQWYRDGAPIAGATNDTYTLVTEDIDAMINLGIVFSNPNGSAPEAFSDEIGPITAA